MVRWDLIGPEGSATAKVGLKHTGTAKETGMHGTVCPGAD
jgi:hypothetical protein